MTNGQRVPTPSGALTPTRLEAFASVKTLEAQQAQDVSVVMDLISAYNLADTDRVLALVYQDVQWADCDYSRETALVVRGRSALRQWLRQRFAEHDRLEIGSLTIHGLVIGVAYARRTSDTLRGRGFTGGIEPKGATKVVFHAESPPRDYGIGGRDTIEYFSNASVGGPANYCRLSPAG